MKTINYKQHTVFLLVGPSGSGKTFFSENHLMPQLKAADLGKPYNNVQHISSDNIRRDLLGFEHDKADLEMLHVSEQAFNMLYTTLRMVTTYPVNCDAAIVDTTGLSDEFREAIIKIARSNAYNIHAIVFDYKDKDEYSKHVAKPDNWLISKHVKRLREESLPFITKKNYDVITRIASKDFADYQFVCEDAALFKSCILDKDLHYVAIGDIHGCYDDLVAAVTSYGFAVDGDGKIQVPQDAEQQLIDDLSKFKFVLVGDYIDKGPKVQETIEFIYKNRDRFVLVIGNHENYVYKRLTGELKESKELEASHFTSVKLLQDEEITRGMFMELMEKHTIPFAIHEKFIVTHAPCERKYLTKLSSHSQKCQRNIMYPKDKDFATVEEYKKALEEFLPFIKTESSSNIPFHIFGHIALKKQLRYKNQLGIDTGCAYGNELSLVEFWKGAFKPGFKHIKSVILPAEKELITLFAKEDEVMNLDDVDPYLRGRVQWMANNKVNFISGTMAPADKDEATNSLESLDKALGYYSSKGINKVVLQRKYMGSRCNMYLHLTDIEKCYATSRQGYKIKQVDLTSVFQSMQLKAKDVYGESAEKIEHLIIDGELLPWRALGHGLIDEQYKVVHAGARAELDFLKENKFDEILTTLYNSEEYTNFLLESEKSDKIQLQTKYGHAKYGTLKNAKYFAKSWHLSEEHEQYLQVFDEQITLFGGESPLEFKPFALLKIVYKDGTEKTFFESNNEIVYQALNDDPMLVVHLDNPEQVKAANEFYNNITTALGMEGVVVKPYEVFVAGVAPFIKVRNPLYRTLVYGYDYEFTNKYGKLVKRKSIRRKVSTSISEYKLGKQMLEIPYADISVENAKWVNLAIKLIYEQEQEKTLDPRL